MVLVCKRLRVYLVSHDGGNVDNRPLASCNHRWEQSMAELKLKLVSSYKTFNMFEICPNILCIEFRLENLGSCDGVDPDHVLHLLLLHVQVGHEVSAHHANIVHKNPELTICNLKIWVDGKQENDR